MLVWEGQNLVDHPTVLLHSFLFLHMSVSQTLLWLKKGQGHDLMPRPFHKKEDLLKFEV